MGNPRGSDIAKAVGRTKEGRFGVMFKDLPAFAPSDDLLIQLANDMVDPRAPLKDVSDPTDGRDNYGMPAGYTYFGQFVDHDITRDTTPLNLQQTDPHALTNFDTAMFDLGSVYGAGPAKNPELYDRRQARGAARHRHGLHVGSGRRGRDVRPPAPGGRHGDHRGSAQRREPDRLAAAGRVPAAAQPLHRRRA